MSIGGTPEKCPKPCPSVSFDLNPIEITDASQFGENEINTCSDQIQPVELEDFPEVESNDSESDIDPFSTMYGDMDEDSFHRMMEGNDWTYTPLFSDKEFLNEDWHKYTCTETCAAIGNARHGCESLGTGIQSIREIDDSGCTLLSEIDNMVTNMTGSSILKSTGHTGRVKPVNLSVRFILGDRDPHSEENSESESEDILESEDEWHSCVSSAEEDECFYAADSLDNSQDASYISFPTRSLSSIRETNLSGLAKGCRQPSKSDRVPDLDEKAYLTQKSQVPELDETHLVEGRKDIQSVGDCHGDNHFRLLSNMMEEETHIIDNISDYAGICQVMFDEIDGVKDQSVDFRRADLTSLYEEPGTPLPAINSDRQNQKVGLGNLSLNTPNEIMGDLFHDIYCCSKCVSMDESGIWSILTDTLHYVKSEIDSSVIFSYDQKRHQNSKSKYFDAALSNIPNEIDNHSVDYTYNAKEENFDAANYNVPNVPIYSQALFPKYEEDRYGNLTLFTTSVFRPHESICATYLWTEANTCNIMESEAFDMEGNNMWFKQGKFPINLHAESQGELMDGTQIKVTTLIDTGCSKPILNKKFYDKHPYLQEMPHYSIQSIGVVVADDGVIKVTEAIQFMIKFHGHVFEFIAYLADMSDTFDFVIGQKSMYELEATVDYNNLAFTFLKRSLPIFAKEDYTIKSGKTKDIVLELKDIPFEVHGYKDFPKDGVATVAKLKSAKDSQMVQTLILHLGEDGKTTVQLSNHSNENWKIHEGDMIGCLDMRSSGYFHVSRETLQHILQSSFKDNCSFLSERETEEYFDLYHKDHKEVLNYVSTQMNQRLKQQQGNTELVDREATDEDNQEVPKAKGKDPYPWLDKEDPRRKMTDQEILEKYIDLSDSDLDLAEKKSLYKVLVKYKDAFSLRDEIGLCPNMEIELELNDETPFFIRPFPIKETEKDVVDKEMKKGCMLGILKKGMSSYSSPIMLIPRKLTGIPRIVTDFRHLNSRLVTLQPSIPSS